MLLEACIENLKEAKKAEAFGASRLELCSDLDSEGLTPLTTMIEEVLENVQIPVKIMIRPRAGNFYYSEPEICTMINSIYRIKQFKVAGFVTGALTHDMHVDIETMKRLAEAADPIKLTMHKAIDLTPDPISSLQELSSIPGVSSVLTSGGKATALDGAVTISKMISACKTEIEIIAAGGITFHNLYIIHSMIHGQVYHGRRIVGNLTE